MIRALLILIAMLGQSPATTVVVHDGSLSIDVACKCPRPPACPWPAVDHGGVFPAVMRMDTEYIRTIDYSPPMQDDLYAWQIMWEMLGPVRHHYYLQTVDPVSGSSLNQLCEEIKDTNE